MLLRNQHCHNLLRNKIEQNCRHPCVLSVVSWTKQMAQSSFKIGFLGAGAINFGRPKVPWCHADRLEKIGGFIVVAIVDPDTQRSNQVLQERKSSLISEKFYRDCKLLTDYHDLLHLKPHAVFIGIPPAFRGSSETGKDLELEFVKAGIHVFVEKPLSVIPLDRFLPYSQAVINASRIHKVILSVGYMFRYHAAVLKMKEIIRQHGGQVMAWNARYYFAYTEAINKYWFNSEFSGGPIVEQATHFCDLARFLVGEIDLDSVNTTMLMHNDPSGAGKLAHTQGFEDELPENKRIPRVTISQWRFQNGGVGTMMHSVALPGSRYEANIDVQLDGLKLSLIEPYDKTCVLKVRHMLDGRPNEDKEFTFEQDDMYLRELESFVLAVKANDQSLVQSSYVDALKTYEFTWKIRNTGEKS